MDRERPAERLCVLVEQLKENFHTDTEAESELEETSEGFNPSITAAFSVVAHNAKKINDLYAEVKPGDEEGIRFCREKVVEMLGGGVRYILDEFDRMLKYRTF